MPATAGRLGYMAASTQSEKVGGGGSRKKGGRGGGRGRGNSSGGGKTGGEGSSWKKRLTAAQYQLLMDPTEITHPVRNLVDPALKDSWEIHPENGMALIFDTISPVRQYNRDQPYRKDKAYPFVVYDPNPEDDPNITENDSETEPLNPYEPIIVQ